MIRDLFACTPSLLSGLVVIRLAVVLTNFFLEMLFYVLFKSLVYTNSVVWANSVDKEKVCMKFQNLFSGKNKKNISKCHLLKVLPSMPSLKLLSFQHRLERHC